MVAAAIAGSSVVSAGTSLLAGSTASQGSQQAAQAQVAAQQIASQTSLQEQQNAFDAANKGFDRGTAFQAPLYDVGLGNLYELSAELRTPGTSGSGMTPLGGVPSLTDFSQLPGYQFTLDQGLKATQNAAAAQGLGVSGTALKGASTYAENLANTFGNNYLSNYWANQNNRYNMLYNLAGVGTGAANQISTAATAAGTGQAQAATAAGGQIANATTTLAGNQGAALQAAGNTLAAGYQGAGSGISNALLANALFSGQSASTLGGGGGFYGTGGGTGGL